MITHKWTDQLFPSTIASQQLLPSKPGVFLLIVCNLFVTDLVLKDKIFVYDLANMRMGWTDYDCKPRSLLSNAAISAFQLAAVIM
jgi:hypothetical protein